MAIVNICGFEMGDASETINVAGTASIQTTTKRTGEYALQVNPTTTATGSAQIGSLAANGSGTAGAALSAHMYASFYFRYATKPSADSEQMFGFFASSGLAISYLRINSSGNILVYNSQDALVSTGTAALSQDTWYRIDFYTQATNGGSYELKIDSAAELSGTGNFNFTGAGGSHGSVYLGKVGNSNGRTVDYYFDDLVFSDSAFTAATEVKRMAPDGNGSYTAWTNDVANVDEVPHNSDTDYITSATSGQAETVTLVSGATAGISGTVHAVKSVSIVRDEGGNPNCQTRLRSGSTDNDTSSWNLSTSYAMQAKLYETDPATSAAWVLSALDSVEVGVELNASAACRCTALCAMAAYTPAGGGGGTVSQLMLLGVG